MPDPTTYVGKVFLIDDGVIESEDATGARQEVYTDTLVAFSDMEALTTKPGAGQRFLNYIRGPQLYQMRFLPWAKHEVTHCPAAGKSVLTGPFSGCYAFLVPQGAGSAAVHVGTHRDGAEANKAVKRSFRDWVADQDPTAVKGYDPCGPSAPASGLPAEWTKKYQPIPEVYVLFKPDGKAWTLVLERLKDKWTAECMGFYCSSATKGVLRTWTAIQQDGAFSSLD